MIKKNSIKNDRNAMNLLFWLKSTQNTQHQLKYGKRERYWATSYVSRHLLSNQAYETHLCDNFFVFISLD